MAMTVPSRAPLDTGHPDSERSPFARTAELLAPYKPGKPLIALSLGEPQHPVPDFVGPVLAQHIVDFGRYPLARASSRSGGPSPDGCPDDFSFQGPSIPKAKSWS